MSRVGVSKKKKSPRATGLSQLKKELQRVSEQLESRDRELAEAFEQQTATGEILQVISNSPSDLQPVMNAIAENAARLCGGADARIALVDGDRLRVTARYGPVQGPLGSESSLDRGSVTGRVVVDRQTIHIHDFQAVAADFPRSGGLQRGYRTALGTPLLRDGVPIGAIVVRRTEVRPFTDKQITLLKTFADQAVIAIENAWLLQERETHNRDLAALHDVTAAASQSLEMKPVLDEVVKKITEIFAFDSVSIYLFDPHREYLNSVASFGTHEEALYPPRVFRRGQGLTGRVAETGEPILFENVQTDPRYQELSQTKATQQRDYCFFAIFPIKSKQRFLGTINCIGKQPRQLIAEEIRLIRSMCDQIGVAVENINLFEEVRNKTAELESSNSELRETLEQQTATSEILGVIASSPTDIQPVLDTIAENAARVCGSYDAVIRLVEGNILRLVAHYGPVEPHFDLEQPITRGSLNGRAVVDRQTIHVHDLATEMATEFPESKARQPFASGTRTILVTPLLREGVPIGVIAIRRQEVRPFSDKQIALLETFADQAVIAVENVRLFQELKEALEQQTATSEILGVIASSPTDLQPVLNAIAESAARVCEANDALIVQIEGDSLKRVAHYGPMEASLGRGPRAIDRNSVPGRTIVDRQTLHIRDLAAVPEDEFATAPFARQTGVRTLLATPMMREEIAYRGDCDPQD